MYKCNFDAQMIYDHSTHLNTYGIPMYNYHLCIKNEWSEIVIIVLTHIRVLI